MLATSNFKRKGFTLIELIIVVFVLAIGILGVYSVYSQIISYTTISLSRFTASYLAQEGIEIVRNIRDTNWLKGSSWDSGLVFGGGFNGCSGSYFCEADYDDPALTSYPNTTSPHNLKIADGFYKYSISGSETKFKRKITITLVGDILEVSVLVQWQEKGKTYDITTQENLYNWYKQ